MEGRSPADDVATRLAELMAKEVGDALGHGHQLDDLVWDDAQSEDDDSFPWLVRDDQGRRFEIEWDVTVTELTPKLLAQRKASMERWARWLEQQEQS